MNGGAASKRLVVFEAHPVQYHAPVYQAVAAFGVDLIVCYGSDFSVAGYRDQEFNTAVSWDTDLLGGYEHHFLSRVASGGAADSDSVSAEGVTKMIAKIQPDAILLNGYTNQFDRGSIRAAVKSKLPILFRAETTDHAIKRSWLKQRVRDFMLRRLYARCHRLLYIGTQSFTHYVRLGVPNGKLISSPYCVNAATFHTCESDRLSMRAECRSAYDVTEEQFLLLYSGKLVSRKGVDLLLPALRQVQERLGCAIVLGFLGDGELRAALETDANRDPTVGVRFFGFQNQSQLSRYYHAADAVVLPSRCFETWGLVVNEALHHGVPVIVSDGVGCAPDLISEGVTGSIFRSGSVESLTRSLEFIVQMKCDVDNRQKCREAVEKFSVASAAQGIVQALSEDAG